MDWPACTPACAPASAPKRPSLANASSLSSCSRFCGVRMVERSVLVPALVCGESARRIAHGSAAS
eukprot:6206265-Pleurochrysis_carterae.AAC.1